MSRPVIGIRILVPALAPGRIVMRRMNWRISH